MKLVELIECRETLQAFFSQFETLRYLAHLSDEALWKNYNEAVRFSND